MGDQAVAAPPVSVRRVQEYSFVRSLLAGAAAGAVVDIALFPLDTVKTRLQAPGGFWKAGGFRGIYKGILPVVIGSAPGSALFFTAYDTSKAWLPFERPTVCHLVAACLGEATACLIRVPTETVKQRMQTGMYSSLGQGMSQIAKNEGMGSLYAGYSVTLSREIPFALVQFPLWEHLKHTFAFDEKGNKSDLVAAACGSAAGGLAAAVTTPLDVAKTRIMLDQGRTTYTGGVWNTLLKIKQEEGMRALLSGILPRTKMITIGGFIFFGGYEYVDSLLANKV
eukprot:Hpha_TRINITY_DN13822_c0_g1::TRINITY_DN13822_c0_g1_i1::g.70108::m.70108/K15111/SLC25A26; solute carrier family 25 (mitochondrial S-adenosylmethionine transporter), member 26